MLPLIATILAFSGDGSDPSPGLMQAMEGLQTGANLAQLASIAVGILPVVISLLPFCGGSPKADTEEPAAPLSPPSDGGGGWAVSDGLSGDIEALPPPPHECEEMGLLSGASQPSDDADPCGAGGAKAEEEEKARRPRSSERRRSLSVFNAPTPVASVCAPPNTRQPIRDGAGDVPLEEAERRQAAFEKRQRDGADREGAMRADFHGLTWTEHKLQGATII